MLTNPEHSAILLSEETFRQTERSQETIAVMPPTASFLLQPHAKGIVGQAPGLTANCGRVQDFSGKGDIHHWHVCRGHAIKHRRHSLQHAGQIMLPEGGGGRWHLIVKVGPRNPGHAQEVLSGEAGCWALQRVIKGKTGAERGSSNSASPGKPRDLD